jgi:hypothetical protein
MDGVVAAQTVGLGKVSSGVCEAWVETDDIQLSAVLIDPVDRTAQGCRGDPASAMGSGRGSTCLGVNELARNDRFGAIPQLCGKLGSWFVEHQLDQRRGVEVDDQRLCSLTRSETEPSAVSSFRPLARRRDRCGSRTRPRARRSARGSASSTIDSRATRRPRMVTTTSPPEPTCRRYRLSWSCNSRTPTSAFSSS